MDRAPAGSRRRGAGRRREPAPDHRASRADADGCRGARVVRDARRTGDRVTAGLATRARVDRPSSRRSRMREVAHQLTPDLFARGELPDYLRVALAADVDPHGDADVPARRAAMMLEHADARVRAAGLGVLPTVGPRRAIARSRSRRSPRRSRRPIRSSPALRSMRPASSTTRSATSTALRDQLDGAIVQRARARAAIPSSSADLLRADRQAQDRSRRRRLPRRASPAVPVRARAAAECLRQLGEAVPPPRDRRRDRRRRSTSRP